MCFTFVFTACGDKNSNGDYPPVTGDGGDTGDNGNSGETEDGNPPDIEPDNSSYPETIYDLQFKSRSRVGYSAEYLGETERIKPEEKNGGLEAYPVYGATLYPSTPNPDNNSVTDEQRAIIEKKQNILAENTQITASGSTYDQIDADGNLYLNGVALDRKLYKHTAANGLYYGNVSDDEPAVIKKISISPRGVGNYITGLYAPAGEVLKIEMSEEDFAATGGLVVNIGQSSFAGTANNIWREREFIRMPVIVSTLTTKSATAYVGSYLGGPVYVRPVNAKVSFTVTISGGVTYPHFILGYTTEEEYKMNYNSSAPYFDLEVWDDGVRHSGSRKYSDDFSYSQLYDAAILWEKIGTVSNQVPQAGDSRLGIDFLYDPFIAAGAAVAFVGSNFTNCPPDWLNGSLDAQSFTETGAWGNVHEYNHHYQVYGLENGGEVTNNATSLVSYSLYTKISSGRAIGREQDWWNNYTNPAWVLKRTNTLSAGEGVNGIYSLEAYANLLHSFGQDLFIKAAKYTSTRSTDAYYKALCETTHYDMSYYFKELLNLNPSEELINTYSDLPLYVPVASVFQTGASYRVDGKTCFSRTVQPYRIPVGKPYVFNLAENIVAPDGFTVTGIKYTSPLHGTLFESDGVFTYTPSVSDATSGTIYATVTLTHATHGEHTVTLALEFEQSVAANANTLQKTTYSFTAETLPASIDEAMQNNFAEAEGSTVEDIIYPNASAGLNGNAQIWFPQTYTMTVIKGRLLASSSNRYRISLRGRWYANLYLSYDGGQSYECAVKIENENLGSSHAAAVQAGHYVDVDLSAGQFVDFIMVLRNENSAPSARQCYMSLGWAAFNGETVRTPSEVTNAYNESYQRVRYVPENPYEKVHSATYSKIADNSQMTVIDSYACDANYPITNGLDGNYSNGVIALNNGNFATEENPFWFLVDVGENFTANKLTVYAYLHAKVNNRVYMPTHIKVYVGATQEDIHFVGESQISSSGITVNSTISVNFEEQTVRYYRVEITDMNEKRYATFSEVELSYSVDGMLYSPDSDIIIYRGNWQIQTPLAPFGHVLAAQNATAEFTFTGARFEIISYMCADFSSFEVYIDGELAGEADLSAELNACTTAYFSPKLKEGEHTVRIQSKTNFNIAAVAVY